MIITKNLEYFDVSRVVTGMRTFNLRSLKYLRYVKNLKTLSIHSGKLDNLEEIKILHRLEELNLFDGIINDISAVWDMKTLRSFYMNNCTDAVSLSRLAGLIGLAVIDGDLNPSAPLKELSNIEDLVLQACNVYDIGFVSNMKGLRSLDIVRNNVKDITPLESLTGLESVVIADNDISDLSPLRNLSNIRVLDISDNPISQSSCDISELSCLPFVRKLMLYRIHVTPEQLQKAREIREIHLGSESYSDISFLPDHPKIEDVSLCGSTVRDISYMLQMPNLKSVWLSGNAYLKDDTTIPKLRASGVEVCESEEIA
jgi:internalin A